ncbi:hypothetical protein PMAC_002536 [Pneumocystis sp. 'macacae']|nr:hypothetical protein PMAC_002536 [Pneumocystis sp. 'macacae']
MDYVFTTHFNNTYNYGSYFEVNNNDKLNVLSKKKAFKIINTVDSILFISKNKTSFELINRVFITFQGLLDYPIEDVKCILECRKIILHLDEFAYMHNYELDYFIDYFDFIFSDLFKVEKNTLGKSLIGLNKQRIIKKKYWFNIIDEIQFHIANLEIKKSILPFNFENSIFFLLELRDIGINIKCSDQNSALYTYFFEKKPISYELLASCISLAISIHQKIIPKERNLILIPMITFTCKTVINHLVNNTMITKIPYSVDIIANSVITSPSIDFCHERLLLIISLFRSIHSNHTLKLSKFQLLQNSILKLNLNFSIYDPLVRILIFSKDSDYKKSKYQENAMFILILSNIFLDIQTKVSTKTSDLSFINLAILFISQRLYYQSSFMQKYNISTTKNFTFRLKFNLFPFNNISIGTFSENMFINLNNIEAIQYLNNLFSNILLNAKCDNSNKKNTKIKNTFFSYNFNKLKKIECRGSELNIIISGNEPKICSEHKGILLKINSWKVDYYFSDMSFKGLLFSEYQGKNLLNYKEYVLKKSIFNIIQNSNGILLFNDLKILTVHSENILDTEEPIIEVIKLKLTFNVGTNNKDILLFVSTETNQVYMTYSLLKHYAILLAINILKKTFFQNIHKTPQNHNIENMQTGHFLCEFMSMQIYVSSLKIEIELPAKQFLMLHIYKIKFSNDRSKTLLCEIENIIFYVRSPVIQKFWDKFVNISQFTIHFELIKTSYENIPKITLSTEAIRIRIPHKFTLHMMLESIQNNIKSARQLHYCFFTNPSGYISINHYVKEKILSKIQLKSNIVSLDVEDDPFEARLGLIWRIGLIEQKARIMREKTFNIRAEKIKDYSNLSNDNDQSKLESENEYFFESSFDKQELKQSCHKRYSIKNFENIHGFSENKLLNLPFTTEQAYERLQKYNSQSWIKKFKEINDLQSSKSYSVRHKHWILDNKECFMTSQENILPLPTRPPLLSILFLEINLVFDKPSFPMENLYQFLQNTGKGLPLETKFLVLIPFNLNWKMTEAKVYIRDYPLPLIYIPSSGSSQSINIPTWTLTSDLIIAEQFPEKEAIRDVDICIIPNNIERNGSLFNIKVFRTVTPIKIYGVVDVIINTIHPTQITWGMSLQPAIQDIMRIFGTFSRRQEDLCKLSFWDKIRLNIHVSFKFKWKGDGNVYLTLKGSRDPYHITEDGAGFIKCWKGNVQWNIGCDPDSKNFMIINSDEFILAIPDFTQQARDLMTRFNAAVSTYENIYNTYQTNNINFQKIVMKLKGGVKWALGLVFERHCSDICQKCNGKYQCRTFDFKPHYEVVLRIPEYSHYLHGSLSIICPVDISSVTSKSVDNFKSYNAIHLTPKVFKHFFNWWSLFNGIMSFPLKIGKLFPLLYTSKKKIGHCLVTFKYKLELLPLFLSHIYNYRTDLDWVDKTFTSIGIKGRIKHFSLDVHQKKEEKYTYLKELDKIKKNTNIVIDKAAIDSISTDLRVILSRFNEINIEDLSRHGFNSQKNYDFKINFQKDNTNHFVIDDDLKWVDIDDFIDLNLDLPIKGGPIFQILPLAYIPQFNPYDIQIELIQKRQTEIIEQIDRNKNKLNYIEGFIVKNSKGTILKSQYEKIIKENISLINKCNFINSILLQLKTNQEGNLEANEANIPINNSFISYYDHEKSQIIPEEIVSEQFSDFNNRFFIYNIQLKWYNSVRNILLAYIHQVTQRKGFVYYMSQRAVKFITDLIKEQIKIDCNLSVIPGEKIINQEFDDQEFDDQETNQLIYDLINNTNSTFTIKDERTNKKSLSLDNNSIFHDDFDCILSKNYECQHSYVFKLFAPQIQLQSEKNTQAIAIMTAQNMQLKVFSIMDKSMTDDIINGLVQQKYIVKMDNAQVFVSKKEDFVDNSINLFHTNTYGSVKSNWSPWIPLESIYDFTTTPIAFTRVIDQTSASFKFIKYNRLRLKKNDNLNHNKEHLSKNFRIESPEQYFNSIFVDFPKIIFTANSDQYYVIFLIVTDLLIYIEPTQKEKSERLERLMLAADFSDLTGTAEMVINLQETIRNLEELRTQHRLYYENYNIEHKLVKAKIEAELRDCEDELFYLMKSIVASQKHEDKISEDIAYMSWFLSASEIVWHGLLENNKPFVDFGLSNATYRRTDNFDGSNFNIIEIETILGASLSPKTIFPDLLSPYFTRLKSVLYGRKKKMIRIYWRMLGSIGGIPVMDHFEVNLFPLSIKLEHDTGKKIFEYIFPDRNIMNLTIQEKTSSFKIDTNTDHSSDENSLKTHTWHPFYSNRNSSVSLFMSSIKSPIKSFSCLSKLSPESIKSNSSFQVFYDSEDSHRTDALKSSKSDFQITDLNTFEKADKVNNKSSPKADDDLNQMVLRANNNMTLLYVKVPSVVLCLSYKGPKKKNIEDLNNFVFSIPTIEYRNKTWSYFDLALHLKKEVIKAIIGHTGSLVKDKFIQHRSNQKNLQTRYQHILFKNIHLNYKNRNIEFKERLSDTIKNGNSIKRSYFHFNNKNSSCSFEQSISSITYLPKYKNESEELEESKLRKAKMLLGKFIR